MKSKVLLLDLCICSLWMLSLLFGRGSNWSMPAFAFIALGVMLRLVVAFSLYYQEKRSWLPLSLFGVLTGVLASVNMLGIDTIADYFFCLTSLNYSNAIKGIWGIGLFLWLFVAPFVCYALLFFRKKLIRSELKWKELIGGILWYDRLTKTCSAVIALMLLAFLAGYSMFPYTCLTMCLTAVPLTYWLICHYYQVKSEYLWLLVVGMAFFWYGQQLAGVWRASSLLACFVFVAFVCVQLYRNTRNSFVAVIAALYLGAILPSFSIGYNQYACINYARSGIYYLSPFRGIPYITDSTGELYGLRDRYGLLIEPVYENIGRGVECPYEWEYNYPMMKDGYIRYYNVLNNEFVHEPDIDGELQHCVREILERYFAENGSGYDDRGQIKVADLLGRKIVADVRVSMYGNPSLNYYPERFISDDSVEVAAGQFFQNDSVKVYNNEYKRSLSYAVNVPDSTARYRIYVRLATDSVPSDSALVGIARKVAALKELAYQWPED